MKRCRSFASYAALAAAFLCVAASAARAANDGPHGNGASFRDATGVVSTLGPMDLTNAFFKSLGTNGRSCVTCHQPSDGWSVTPAHIQSRFDATNGLDPIFRTNDGSNCDTLDVSTVQARRKAYSMLLNRGLIRVSIDVPADAEFFVENVDNPYGCTSKTSLALYRRPLPSTNLRFLSTVMWDGRESLPGNTLVQNLMHQANDATMGHAQGAAISPGVQTEIVNFEMGLTTAQSFDDQAGNLTAEGGLGGPDALSTQVFFIGINDPLGPNPAAFNPNAFDIFRAWLHLPGQDEGGREALRRSVARGEDIFNNRPIRISGVPGLNEFTGDPYIGHCTTCHNTPNVGNHSVTAPLNIGLNDPSRRTPDMPLITLVNKTTLERVSTMDPGRALISGKWADIGKTKGPVLRGLAARSPYFHNGSAATLHDAVDFYETRFNMGLSEQDKQDLVNFLRSL